MFFMNGQLKQIQKRRRRGFTLLELLIVIAILAVLAVILVLVLNPGETLKKARDVQRMSDLATMKTALGLILVSSTTPYLTNDGNSSCLRGAGATGIIFYSSEVANPTCVNDPTEGAEANGTFASDACTTVGTTGASDIDGTGWIPVKFDWLAGGSPISNLPLDPTKTSIGTTPSSADLVYRYACQSVGGSAGPSTVFEFNVVLESDAFTVTDNKMTKDGGDNSNYYEAGTNLKLLGTATSF